MDIVETTGQFNLRYGYNSSMDLRNILFALESKGIDADAVSQVIAQMSHVGVPVEKLANYLADYYKLFGW